MFGITCFAYDCLLSCLLLSIHFVRGFRASARRRNEPCNLHFLFPYCISWPSCMQNNRFVFRRRALARRRIEACIIQSSAQPRAEKRQPRRRQQCGASYFLSCLSRQREVQQRNRRCLWSLQPFIPSRQHALEYILQKRYIRKYMIAQEYDAGGQRAQKFLKKHPIFNAIAKKKRGRITPSSIQ